MKTLAERCLQSLYKQKLDSEDEEFLKKFGLDELSKGQYKLVDGRVYRRTGLIDINMFETEERWRTHEYAGDYMIALLRRRGRVREQRFCRNGYVLFREAGPATLIFHENGKLAAARWANADASAARIPWEMAWDEHGNKQHEVWRIDNGPRLHDYRRYDMHREGGPALTVWHPNGIVRRVEWWRHGTPCRNDRGFSVLIWHDDGTPAISDDVFKGRSVYPSLRGVDPGLAYCLCYSPWEDIH